MDYRTFAAVGGIAIGLIASAVIFWFSIRRATSDPERRAILRWSAAFSLAICTFMGVIPFLVPCHEWVLVLPLLGTWLALDSLHRATLVSEIPARQAARLSP